MVSRFDRNRGTALAILLSGQAATYGLLPIFALEVIRHSDRRMVYYLLAAYVLLLGWPLAYFFFYSAGDLQRRNPQADYAAPLRPARGGTFRAMRRRHFRLIAIAYFVAGWALLLPGVCYLILIFAGTSYAAGIACAIVVGIAAGAETDVLAYLVSRYFGPQYFSSLYGALLGIFAVGYGLGPVLTGRVFDVTGSYAPSLIVLACGAALASFLIVLLGRPRNAAELAKG